VAGLQILYAARAEALRDNKEFIWTQVSAACDDMAALAGMSRFLGFAEPADCANNGYSREKSSGEFTSPPGGVKPREE
jgi:hypothetical protein